MMDPETLKENRAESVSQSGSWHGKPSSLSRAA